MTLVYLATAWLAGIALGAWAPLPPLTWLALGATGGVVLLLSRRERHWLLGGALLIAVSLGALRIALSPLHASPLGPYLGRPLVSVTGMVAAAPELRPARADLVLAVESLDDGGQTVPLRDSVLLRLPREVGCRYGDRLIVTGRLQEPEAVPGFSYRDYLARRGIHAIVDRPQVEILARGQGSPVRAALIALAGHAEEAVNALWPAPESALLAGILLGREQAIPEPLLQAFNDTGTRHIIAISGFNITLLAGALTSVFLTFLNRRATAPVVTLLLAFYVVLVGADPAVVRAAVMGGLTLLALLAGRRADATTGLGLAAFLMTLLNPWQLWEPGFQLSFAATLGLIHLLSRLEAHLGPGTGTVTTKSAKDAKKDAEKKEKALFLRVLGALGGEDRSLAPRWLREAVLVSLAAQMATLPITLGTFGRLSLVAPIANLLILPVQPLVMELGALATVLGTLWRPLGQPIAWLAWPCTAYTIAVVEWLGRLPFAAVDLGGLGGVLPWLLYPAAAFALWLRQEPARREALRGALTRHLPTKALLLGLAALAAFVWAGAVRAPDGRLHVTFLDVGQGDAILIQTPDGKRLLVDGGPDPTLLPAALARRLAPWERTLDLVALTHPDEDHMAGLLPILRGYRVGLILDTRIPRETPTGQAWLELVAPLRATMHHTPPTTPDASRLAFDVSCLEYPTPGTLLDLGSGARLQVLHPPEALLQGTPSDDNNNSLVLRLAYGRVSFLLTGDLGLEGEAYLLRQEDLPLQSTVLKVSHHGAKEGTTARFLEAVRPQLAVISAGRGNRFGHPSAEVLQRLGEAGVQVWQTDECGDVEVVTDGERLWVRTGQPHSSR